MTPVFVAVRLWSKTVAMNAVLYGMSGLFIYNSPIHTMMGCTITGLVFTTRKSLIKLHTEKAEEISMHNSL